MLCPQSDGSPVFRSPRHSGWVKKSSWSQRQLPCPRPCSVYGCALNVWLPERYVRARSRTPGKYVTIKWKKHTLGPLICRPSLSPYTTTTFANRLQHSGPLRCQSLRRPGKITGKVNSRFSFQRDVKRPQVPALKRNLSAYHITHLFSCGFTYSSQSSCLFSLSPPLRSRIVSLFSSLPDAAGLRQGEPGDAAPEANAPLFLLPTQKAAQY